jgi:hypothetical protein
MWSYTNDTLWVQYGSNEGVFNFYKFSCQRIHYNAVSIVKLCSEHLYFWVVSLTVYVGSLSVLFRLPFQQEKKVPSHHPTL